MQIKIKGSYFESNWKHIEQDNPRTYPRPYEKILVWLNASAFQSQAVNPFFGLLRFRIPDFAYLCPDASCKRTFNAAYSQYY